MMPNVWYKQSCDDLAVNLVNNYELRKSARTFASELKPAILFIRCCGAFLFSRLLFYLFLRLYQLS
jgi:hypothetical protein